MHFVQAKGILSKDNGMNLYRGCTHGCIYCDSRSKCYGFTHAFEDIEVKENAPFLLKKALRSKRQKCMIGTGAMCDPYLHEEDLCRILEPHVSTTKERVEVLLKCKELGIPTIVWLSPILPFINDTEENIRGILDYCTLAGVKGILFFGIGVTLREGDREYFYQALDKDFPGLKAKYIRTYGNAYELPEKYIQQSLF